MRLRKSKSQTLLKTISIHAPLTGCDYGHFHLDEKFENFNPRTPYGMRQGMWSVCTQPMFISIHAPLTGCDIVYLAMKTERLIFQSTHPLRDATRYKGNRESKHQNFNPRTPYGMRHCGSVG